LLGCRGLAGDETEARARRCHCQASLTRATERCRTSGGVQCGALHMDMRDDEGGHARPASTAGRPADVALVGRAPQPLLILLYRIRRCQWPAESGCLEAVGLGHCGLPVVAKPKSVWAGTESEPGPAARGTEAEGSESRGGRRRGGAGTEVGSRALTLASGRPRRWPRRPWQCRSVYFVSRRILAFVVTVINPQARRRR
jgi:hypothetical protein